ncbi:DUF1330 domain-containing protein [Phenylobacterium sp.]|uniref:DUF1330 domain-containing protein n=1 Tax=Phenylobacterium sp. TaxID=1871053 RepID=UPI0025E30FCB|nr:DUF1330 domain-containing protein [Phenylobacterium sp.]
MRRRTAMIGAGVAALALAAGAAWAADAPAYVVNEINVTDAAKFGTYVAQVPATFAPFGGEYVIRGGAPEAVHGGEPPQRLVVLKFPSREKARAWRASPAYQAILPIREASSTSRVYIVDGYVP